VEKISHVPLTESIEDMTKEELLNFVTDLSKRWLAHDGLWFQAAEKKYGMEAAIELDTMAWEKFTEIEAKRIMKFLNLPQNGGLISLAKALQFRLYSFINEQEIDWISNKKIVFRMTNCRVQAARRRKNMPDFPCKSVGIVEYTGFARTIDKRIETKCIGCPPDEGIAGVKDYFCAWEFTLNE